MLRTLTLLLFLSSCSVFRGTEETQGSGDLQRSGPAMMRIVVRIPAACFAGNYEVEIEGKIQGMHKPGDEVVYFAEPGSVHSVIVRRKRFSWKQELRPREEQQEWAVEVPCDSLR